MLKKYFNDKHPQKEEKLQLAATYASDRGYLFQLLSEQDEEIVNVPSSTDEINPQNGIADTDIISKDVTPGIENSDNLTILPENEEGLIEI